MGKVSGLGYATIGLSVFGLLCICVSLGIDHWIVIQNKDSSFVVNSGLWRYCSKTEKGGKICKYVAYNSQYGIIRENYEIFRLVRTMMLLSVFCVCGGVSCIALKLFVMTDKTPVSFVASGCHFLAGVCLMSAFAVFDAEIFRPAVNQYEGEDSGYTVTAHAGFAICILAWLITWMATGISAAMAFIKDETSEAKLGPAERQDFI